MNRWIHYYYRISENPSQERAPDSEKRNSIKVFVTQNNLNFASPMPPESKPIEKSSKVTIAQVKIKKPYYGIKAGVISEFSSSNLNIESKRSSLTNIQSKSNKNSHRELLWTPTSMINESKKKQINLIYPSKIENSKARTQKWDGIIERSSDFILSGGKSWIRKDWKVKGNH